MAQPSPIEELVGFLASPRQEIRMIGTVLHHRPGVMDERFGADAATVADQAR
ncbi:hypothetical protein ABW21_db0207946 [Orbilia brochopaga]|nr:hypothetical protein ABW21_db0207946 [Drechslerella brochopaga]